jgi:hypothetical protein
MQISQYVVSEKTLQPTKTSSTLKQTDAQLVLVMAERTCLEDQQPYVFVQSEFPNAKIVTISTAGQIAGVQLFTNQIVVTAIRFTSDQTSMHTVQVSCEKGEVQAAKEIHQALPSTGLRGICLFSDGALVNGTELIDALSDLLPTKALPIFGGLAGDGALFERTLVGIGSDVSPGQIVAIGLYGDALQLNFGSQGGWSDFGPEREITHAEKNVLYKIGDRPALDLYKEYLGKHASQLPSSALFFPLSMRSVESNEERPVVRTILSINEENKSMTFAGSMIEGSKVRLSMSSAEDLIDAATDAAKQANPSGTHQTELALLVTCVGRKLVLGERTEEELEAVQNVFGPNTAIAGFYSYGEISPNIKGVHNCDLHNQTMTIATISER